MSLQQPGYFGPFRIVPNGGTTAFASEILRIIVQNHQDTSLQNSRTSESKLPMPPNSQILSCQFDVEYLKQHLVYRKVKNEMQCHQCWKIYPDFKSTWSTGKEMLRRAYKLDYCYIGEGMLGDKHIKTTGDL
jgi:hypothetical protein